MAGGRPKVTLLSAIGYRRGHPRRAWETSDGLAKSAPISEEGMIMDHDSRFSDLFEAAAQGRTTRRVILKRAAALGLSAPAIAALLAACGGSSESSTEAPAATAASDGGGSTATSTSATGGAAQASATSTASTDSSASTRTVGRGGELVAALSERSLTLDPANHYSISSTSVCRHIFDPLIDVTDKSEFIPALAESWDAVDNTTWRFKLRQGVKFHDGSPFNANSVVFSLERVRDNTELIKSFVYQVIESVTKEDDYTVVVKTKTPFGPLPGHLTMLGMLPTSVDGNEESFFNNPVGTGPFKFVKWTRGEEVVMEANTDYWKPGVPKVQKVTFRFIPEISTRIAGLRSGEFQVVDRVTPDLVQTIQDSKGVKAIDVQSVETQQWLFQMERQPVSDVKLRQAISLGIDRDTIIKDLMLGYAKPCVCPTPPTLVGHVDLGVKPYDPKKATQMVKDGGYEGTKLDFVLMKGFYPKQLEIAQAVAAMLGEVGLDINIQDAEIAQGRSIRAAGEYDWFYSGWTHMPHDPDWYFGQWFTKDGAAKLSRYNNPTVEQLIVDARVPDRDVRQKKYEEMQKILWNEEEPTIWPFYSVAIYGVSDQIQNYEARSDYYVLLSDVSVS